MAHRKGTGTGVWYRLYNRYRRTLARLWKKWCLFLGSSSISASRQANNLKVTVDLGSEILVEVLPLGETSSGEGVNDQRHVYEKAYEKVGTVTVDLGSGILVEVLPLGETSSGKGVNDQHHVYEKAYEEVGTDEKPRQDRPVLSPLVKSFVSVAEHPEELPLAQHGDSSSGDDFIPAESICDSSDENDHVPVESVYEQVRPFSASQQANDLKVTVDLGSGILVEVLPLGETSSGKGVNDQHHVYEKAYEEVGTDKKPRQDRPVLPPLVKSFVSVAEHPEELPLAQHGDSSGGDDFIPAESICDSSDENDHVPVESVYEQVSTWAEMKCSGKDFQLHNDPHFAVNGTKQALTTLLRAHIEKDEPKCVLEMIRAILGCAQRMENDGIHLLFQTKQKLLDATTTDVTGTRVVIDLSQCSERGHPSTKDLGPLLREVANDAVAQWKSLNAGIPVPLEIETLQRIADNAKKKLQTYR